MSTRCNIVLRAPQGACIWIYRHGDGYPCGSSGVLDMLQAVGLSISSKHYDYEKPIDPDWRMKWIGTFARQLLGVTGSGGDLLHELTAGAHSDIEFLYLIDFAGFSIEGGPLAAPKLRISEALVTYNNPESEPYKAGRRFERTTPSLKNAEAQEALPIFGGPIKWKSASGEDDE